jgi:hypothetical protein
MIGAAAASILQDDRFARISIRFRAGTEAGRLLSWRSPLAGARAVVAAAGFCWLGIVFTLTFSDFVRW